jgi:predicted nucleic-acid-binding Zn-ribbon protein
LVIALDSTKLLSESQDVDFRKYEQIHVRCDDCGDIHDGADRQPFFESYGPAFHLRPSGSRCPKCGSFDSTELIRCGGCLKLFEYDQLSKDALCDECERVAA